MRLHTKALSLLISFLILAVIFQACTSQDHYPEADRLIQTAMKDSLFAGAVLLYGSSDEILHQQAFGYASLVDSNLNRVENPEIMTENHVFDLASLTKVLATTNAVIMLHDQGLLHVDDPVYDYLPLFDIPDKRAITLRHLLTHTSGLMQWYPTFYEAENAAERLEFIATQPLIAPTGEQRKYSDLGFMVLADIVEKVSGQPFNEYLQENLYQPLGLENTLFNPGENYPNVVSTSHGNPFEKKMVMDDTFGYTVEVDTTAWDDWRSYTLKGEVNDGNAFHTHSGVAGHAGLFSNAQEIYKLTVLLLNQGEFNGVHYISPDTIHLFLTKDKFNNGLGWAMDPAFLSVENLPEEGFGHTGFTGTMVIASPETDRILVLLTNRQHFGVNKKGYYPDINNLRKDLAALFM